MHDSLTTPYFQGVSPSIGTGTLQNETVVGILAASILIIVFLEMLRSSKIHIFQRTKKFESECFEYSGMFNFWTFNLHN
jgi:hypothetical protein